MTGENSTLRWSRAGFGLAVLLFSAHCVAVADEVERLRVGIKHVPPFVFTDGATPRGFSIDLWGEVSGLLGASTEYVPLDTVNELLTATAHGTVDVAIAAITINEQRESIVDFSHPFYRSGLRIGVATRTGPSWLSTIRRFLSPDLLVMFITLVAVTLLAAHVLWAVERGVNSECFPKTYFAGVGEAMWWSVATIISGGCENKSPVSVLGRLVAAAWMLGSIVLVAAFTATLASQMTADTVAGTISGPEDLPGKLAATVAGTSVVDSLNDRSVRVNACKSLVEALSQASDGTVEAVVFDAPVLAHTVKERPELGIRLVGPLFEHQDYAITLPQGSELRETVNKALLRLSESGVLAELHSKWFGEN